MHTDINAKDDAGRTALILAAWQGHLNVVDILLENNADISEKDYYEGWTALIHAAWNGDKEIVETLLQNNANVNEKTSSGRTPGFTPLMLASYNGHKDIVEILIQNNADINAKDDNGSTALFYTLFAPRKAGFVQNSKGWRWEESRHLWILTSSIIQNGRKKIVEILLENSDVNETDKGGFTALIYASFIGDKDIVKMLIEKKADVNAKSKRENETPLRSAAMNGHKEIVELLIHNNADVNDNKNGETALSLSSKNGHKDIVYILIQNNADINVKGIYNRSGQIIHPGGYLMNIVLRLKSLGKIKLCKVD